MRCLAIVAAAAAVAPVAVRASPITAFASTPVQIQWASDSFWLDPDLPHFANDTDVVAMHDDYYGVPWETMLSGGTTPPPLSWVIRLNMSLTAAQRWGKPVFLTLQMMTGTLRTCPAANATDGPGDVPLVVPFAGCQQCWDFDPAGANPLAAPVQRAFALYAALLVRAYLSSGVSLVGVNFAPEINLGERLCGPAWWAGVVAFSNGVYDVVKKELAAQGAGDVPAFPSVQLEVVLGVQTGPDQPCVGMVGQPTPPPAVLRCIDDGLALVAPLRKDLFGVSTYPYDSQAGLVPGPRWQPWYVTAVLDRMAPADAAGFFVAETGFLTAPLVVNLANGTVGAERAGDPPLQCTLLLNTTSADADAWLSYLVGLAAARSWPMVVWWSHTDLLARQAMGSCPCAAPLPAGQTSCAFVSAYREVLAATSGTPWVGELDAKAFGTMGARSLDGSPVQPLYGTLQAARAAGGPWVPGPLTPAPPVAVAAGA